MTGQLKASELFPDSEERVEVRKIVEMFNGTITYIEKRTPKK